MHWEATDAFSDETERFDITNEIIRFKPNCVYAFEEKGRVGSQQWRTGTNTIKIKLQREIGIGKISFLRQPLALKATANTRRHIRRSEQAWKAIITSHKKRLVPRCKDQ